jgi:serine phosphatase RsbU (regulator of sigma subunit)
LVKSDYFRVDYYEHGILGYEYWNDFVIFLCLTMGFLFLSLYLFFSKDNLNLWIGLPFFLIGSQSLFITKISVYLPYEYQYLVISYWTALLNIPQYLYMVILAYYILFFRKFLPQTKYLTILVLLDVFLRLLNRFPTTYQYSWVSWYDESYYYNYILTLIFLSELLRVSIVGTWRKKGAFIALIGTVCTYLLFSGGLISLILFQNYTLTNNLWLFCVLSLAILSAVSMAYRNSVVLKYLHKQLARVQKLSSEKQIILENQNEELEHQVSERTIQLHEANEELLETNEFVQSKSAVFEEQNKEINESISYAQNIQSAMLPTLSYIQEYIPESFILFKPRDVVSGDFYYFSEKNGCLIIAAVDCTGHGVPGAFMSMIGNDILNNLVEVQGIVEADIILNELHKGIRQVLKQKETNNKDGMDISLLVIDQANASVEYSGAKNPLFYIQNNIAYEAAASKMSIGGDQQELDRKYFKHTISISPVEEKEETKTIFYLFSDGYQDQFGGEQKRKFMTRRMKELFVDIHNFPMDRQKEILDQKIIEWMEIGHEKQIDDILVIGVRI